MARAAHSGKVFARFALWLCAAVDRLRVFGEAAPVVEHGGRASHRAALTRWFAGIDGALVAFSGGVDSSLVAYLANRHLGRECCRAVISASPSLKLSELDVARAFAAEHGIALEVIVTAEIEDPNYTANPANRCYHCKHALYQQMETFRGRFPGWVVLNGQNADDAGDYRPGLQAAREFAVRAPLAECGLDKAAVRTLAADLGLDCWDKPASPCLASRVPYGEVITVAKLRQIESAEAVVIAAGFPVVRIRHLGDTAKIEVPTAQIPALDLRLDAIASGIRATGFDHVTVDSEGFVSGKLNRVLNSPSARA